MKYKISQKASDDLENIWLYTLKNWSIEQADKYFNLLLNGIEFIAINPTSGIDYKKIRKGYFCSRIQSHLIFYKINQKNEVVEIIRILHKRMEIEERLKE
jgi:toxin ParE1/3/4